MKDQDILTRHNELSGLAIEMVFENDGVKRWKLYRKIADMLIRYDLIDPLEELEQIKNLHKSV